MSRNSNQLSVAELLARNGQQPAAAPRGRLLAVAGAGSRSTN